VRQRWSGALALAAGLAPAWTRAETPPGGCPTDGDASAELGTVARVGACNTYILTSDAAAGVLSRARATWLRAPTRPYRLTLTVQRLDADAERSVAVGLLGGWLLLRTGAWGFYEGEPEFARDGWQAAPFVDPRRETRLEIEEGLNGVSIRIDGHALPRWQPKRNELRLRFELKAAPGERARMRVADLRLEPLPGPSR